MGYELRSGIVTSYAIKKSHQHNHKVTCYLSSFLVDL